MPPTLTARNLTKRFGPVVAVEDLSLEVGAGEIVGLLGPNGAGKTTTLRMLAGILTPDAGSVHVNQQDLRDSPLEAKQRIGFLSGDTQLYRRMRPTELLDYFGRLYGMNEARRRRRIRELIQRLEIGPFAGQLCGTLSSGQKQRVNIARAFLHEPDLLILDEPTAALDVISGHFVIQAIRQEKASGRAVLFSTHVMGEAEYLCDRILLLHQGRLMDQGPLPALLERSGCANLTDTFLRWSDAEASQ